MTSKKSILSGKRVGITRSAEGCEEWAEAFRVVGADPISIPTIRFQLTENMEPVDKAIENLNSFELIIFTSRTAFRYFFNRVQSKGLRLDKGKFDFAVVGDRTRELLEKNGMEVKFCPPQPKDADELGSFLASKLELRGRKILLPMAKKGRENLPRFLGEKGADVQRVDLYETVESAEGEPALRQELEKGVDWVTFASGSAVKAFFSLLGHGENTAQAIFGKNAAKIAAIGKTTSGELTRLGYEPDVVSESPSVSSLIGAMEGYSSKLGG